MLEEDAEKLVEAAKIFASAFDRLVTCIERLERFYTARMTFTLAAEDEMPETEDDPFIR